MALAAAAAAVAAVTCSGTARAKDVGEVKPGVEIRCGENVAQDRSGIERDAGQADEGGASLVDVAHRRATAVHRRAHHQADVPAVGLDQLERRGERDAAGIARGKEGFAIHRLA